MRVSFALLHYREYKACIYVVQLNFELPLNEILLIIRFFPEYDLNAYLNYMLS